ncbi:MAG: hypothetical protein DSY42_02075 [Aquifex sp.]|nr:MAG: hypothetical protein DSY42_02075 [Aquifex sp.]
MSDYTNFWKAIHNGNDWWEILQSLKEMAGGNKRKFQNLNRQKNRVRAYLEGRSVQRRSGKYTEWVHEAVARAIHRYLPDYDVDEIFLAIFHTPPAGYELRGYLTTLQELAEYIKIIPLEYIAIVPTSSGWAVYVSS